MHVLYTIHQVLLFFLNLCNHVCWWLSLSINKYIYIYIYIHINIYIYIYLYIIYIIYIILCIYNIYYIYNIIYIYIYILTCVSGFPSWYILISWQTSGRGTQLISHKSHVFVDQIATAVTTSVYIKYISRFKIIWRYLSQKYNKENIFFYWLFKGVCDLRFDFDQGDCLGWYFPSP